MKARRALILAAWLICMAVAARLVAHAHYITDLSAFLPAKPTPLQRLLIDQLQHGPASRLILIALEEGDAATRAGLAQAMAARLRRLREFSMVDDGEALTAAATQDFVFQHRYLLSDAVTPARFSAAGLRAAIGETVANLASTSGLMLKSLVPRDPTGETLHIIDQWSDTPAPRTQDGVWQSADGVRTLLIAQTAAPGSDTDAQERAEDAIARAFRASVSTAFIASPASIASAPSTASAGAAGVAGVAGARGSAAPAVRLRMSGPGIFAVAARAKIKLAATRLSILGSLLVIGMLLSFYRSLSAVLLGVLPVATGALFGIAAVALGFGAVHGITLGFGITLIGESVDYSIYFFIQSR